MWARLCVTTLLGLVLALSVSIGLASSNDYPVGRAVLLPTGTSTVSGTAIIRRQLTAGTTHVQVRVAGASSTSAPIAKVESGAACGATPTATLITQSTPSPVTSLGTFMTADTYAVTIPLTSTSSMITVRIYSSGTAGSVELACGQVYNQPSQTGSEHWW